MKYRLISKHISFRSINSQYGHPWLSTPDRRKEQNFRRNTGSLGQELETLISHQIRWCLPEANAKFTEIRSVKVLSKIIIFCYFTGR